MVERSATFSIADTDAATTARLVERWRSMRPEEKLRMMNDASVMLTQLELAGIRHRGEARTDTEAWQILLRRRFDPAVAEAIGASRNG